MSGDAYVAFERIGGAMPHVKTEVWHVLSVRRGDVLGMIKWYGPWRQYAFYPAVATIWNPDCLESVTDKIETLMRLRANVRANQRRLLAASESSA